MEMQPVHSSNIDAIGYNADAQELHVKFKGGSTYHFFGVTPEQHADLMGAQSKGSHFARQIRPHHPAKKAA